MASTLHRAGVLLLGAVLLASAAPAQTFNNLVFQGSGVNELTSVVRGSDTGYMATANFPDGAALVKFQLNGDLQWARHYGASSTQSLRAVQVHPVPQAYAWTGHEIGPDKTYPTLVLTDLDGNAKWARRIDLGMNAEVVKALEYDEISFWIGGTGWPGHGGADPWIARITTSGDKMWVRSFHFNLPCQLNSLTISDDGGVVAVGQVLVDVQGSLKQRMFALKVDPQGNLQWAARYNAQKVEVTASQQWLVDISNTGSLLYVTGVVTGLCTDPLSPSCVQRPRSILVATIDQTSGSLQNVRAVYDQHGRSLWAKTISGSSDRIGIGGRVDNNSSDSEALLVSGVFGQQVSMLQGKLYGDGAGPFTSEVEDVAWTDVGYVLVTQQRHSSFRPAILKTDQNLSTGQACEYGIPLGTASVSTTQKLFQLPPPTSHEISRIRIADPLIHPTKIPCTHLVP